MERVVPSMYVKKDSTLTRVRRKSIISANAATKNGNPANILAQEDIKRRKGLTHDNYHALFQTGQQACQ